MTTSDTEYPLEVRKYFGNVQWLGMGTQYCMYTNGKSYVYFTIKIVINKGKHQKLTT